MSAVWELVRVGSKTGKKYLLMRLSCGIIDGIIAGWHK